LGGALADVGVVDHVADQKKGRGKNGRDHAGDVLSPVAAPDEVPAAGNEDGAHEVERGVDGGKIAYLQEAERPTSNV
jgi:hypothetical protein